MPPPLAIQLPTTPPPPVPPGKELIAVYWNGKWHYTVVDIGTSPVQPIAPAPPAAGPKH